jgi:transposase InsO family protein
VKYIESHKSTYGVEPICDTLQIAPSTYYSAVLRPPSARQLSDERLKPQIRRVHGENLDVYGARKVWLQMGREGIAIGRDRAARLMRELRLFGARRGKRWRTTIPDQTVARPADLVNRQFTAIAPNRLWVADLTYVATWQTVAYVAFIIDVFSRFIVGWRVAFSMRTELVLDALEQAIWSRGSQDLSGLVHHADLGSQYLSIRYTERLADVHAVVSVGSRGDSYDKAYATDCTSFADCATRASRAARFASSRRRPYAAMQQRTLHHFLPVRNGGFAGIGPPHH